MNRNLLVCQMAQQPNVINFPRPKVDMGTNKSVVRVRMQSSTRAEMDLFGIIGGDWMGGGVTKEDFARELRAIGSGVKQVDVRVSSPGGDAFDGRAIANMIRDHSARFAMNVIAEASSAASIIVMAGDTVNMSDGSVMLIHRCFTLAMGNCQDFRSIANDLETIDDSAIATYRKKTGMTEAEIRSLMEENRYMSAAECKKLGFADTVSGATESSVLKVAAFNGDRKFLHLPPLPEGMSPQAVGRRNTALAALQRIEAARR